MAQVIVRENESLESALKRFKRLCARDGVMAEVRKREHYEKPSVKRKKKSEALSDFEKAGRQDLIAAYKSEIAVLKKELPEQLSPEKIAEIVRETAASMGIEGGKENMGKLMGAVMGKTKGLADGNEVRKQVMAFLG